MMFKHLGLTKVFNYNKINQLTTNEFKTYWVIFNIIQQSEQIFLTKKEYNIIFNVKRILWQKKRVHY